MGDLARMDKDLKEYESSLAEAVYRLEDVAASISSYESEIEDDPQRLAGIEERLDLISRLKRKYGATIEEILQRAAEDQKELDGIAHRDELIADLQKQDAQFRLEVGGEIERVGGRGCTHVDFRGDGCRHQRTQWADCGREAVDADAQSPGDLRDAPAADRCVC